MVVSDTSTLLGIVVAIATFAAPSFRDTMSSVEITLFSYVSGCLITSVTTFAFIMPLLVLFSGNFQESASAPSETYTAVFIAFSLISVTAALIFNYQMYVELSGSEQIHHSVPSFSLICAIFLVFFLQMSSMSIGPYTSDPSQTVRLLANVALGLLIFTVCAFTLEMIQEK